MRKYQWIIGILLNLDYYNFNVYPHGTKLDIGSLFIALVLVICFLVKLIFMPLTLIKAIMRILSLKIVL
jgi:hypothetical protein